MERRPSRGRKGKLTPDQVREIRKRLRAHEKQEAVAADYGVGQALVCMIGSRKLYRWVAD